MKSGRPYRTVFPAFLMVLVAFALIVAAGPAEARRYAAMVVDNDTGDILFSRNSDSWVYPASLTKMMTLYLVFESIEAGKIAPTTKLRVSKQAAQMPASKLGLRTGSTITVREAIGALTIKSANDVAVVVAEGLAGSEQRFAELMTARARQLGMASTTFRNASGLPNSAQRTTARDMIQLSRRLIDDFPGYYHLFSAPSFAWSGQTFRTHNRLMARYAGMDGLKTGYIGASGFNLAASAKRDGRRLVAVVFGGKTGRSRDAHMEQILNQSFASLKKRPQFVVLPRQRPEFEALIARASDLEQGSTDLIVEPEARAVRDDPESARSAPAPTKTSQEIPQEFADAVQQLDADAVPTSSMSRPNRLMPAQGPAISALRKGPSKLEAEGRYGVQVGAYHDPAKARRAALTAARKVPSILLRGNIDISGLQGRRKQIYRARVIGLSLQAAEQACAALKRQEQECIVVQAQKIDLATLTD